MRSLNLVQILRKTKLEERYSPQMGILQTKVTYIQKAFAGIPLVTLHKYRETYYGEVKDCKDCILQA